MSSIESTKENTPTKNVRVTLVETIGHVFDLENIPVDVIAEGAHAVLEWAQDDLDYSDGELVGESDISMEVE